MKTSSAKQKGRKLQQLIRDEVLKSFPQLSSRDVVSTPMGCTGSDLMLSQAAADLFPFAVECKNQESISIWKALEQSEQDDRGLTPLLVFKRNRTKPYVALSLEAFMKALMDGSMKEGKKALSTENDNGNNTSES